MRTLRIVTILILPLVLSSRVFAVVDTDFSEATLDPNVLFDIPNAALATITHDTVNNELDFDTTGNTDLWVNRNNAPLAWSAAPAVGMGQTWFVETQIRYNSSVASTTFRVAGITFYGGPDSTGGSAQGMDFSFGINNWDDRDPSPGYQASVEVQGLGDNTPGDLGANLTATWTNNSAYLRVVVTENGASDTYVFFYKLNAGDPWISLGTLNSSVDNSRATLFWKNGTTTPAPDRSGSFTFFRVGTGTGIAAAVPVPTLSSWGTIALVIALLGFLGWRRQRFDFKY